ncbi:hypothetical protein B0H34DRAFT_665455, partial [Crassisporium funariophilum]
VDYNDLDIIYAIEEPCNAVKTKLVPNLAAAARQYGIHYGTLRNRYLSITQPTKQAHNDKRFLNNSQEKVLVEWMQFLGAVGRPISRSTLRPKIKDLCGWMPGRTWIWRFLC